MFTRTAQSLVQPIKDVFTIHVPQRFVGNADEFFGDEYFPAIPTVQRGIVTPDVAMFLVKIAS